MVTEAARDIPARSFFSQPLTEKFESNAYVDDAVSQSGGDYGQV
jgi:hypothetical protein